MEEKYMGYTPDYIDSLLPKQIFVFGVTRHHPVTAGCQRLVETDLFQLAHFILEGTGQITDDPAAACPQRPRQRIGLVAGFAKRGVDPLPGLRLHPGAGTAV